MFNFQKSMCCLFLSCFSFSAYATDILDCSYSINYRNGQADESGAFTHEVSECIDGLPCALEPTEINTNNSCLRFFSQTSQGQDDLIVSFSECNEFTYYKAKAKKNAETLSVGAEVGPRMIWIDCRL